MCNDLWRVSSLNARVARNLESGQRPIDTREVFPVSLERERGRKETIMFLDARRKLAVCRAVGEFYNVRVYRFPRSLYRSFRPAAFAELTSFARRKWIKSASKGAAWGLAEESIGARNSRDSRLWNGASLPVSFLPFFFFFSFFQPLRNKKLLFVESEFNTFSVYSTGNETEPRANGHL